MDTMRGVVRVGEEEHAVRYLKTASKGDTIFGVPGQWLIAVNFPWELAEKLNSSSSFTVFAEKIKEVPERKYSLIKVTTVERSYRRLREEIEHKHPEEHEFYGIKVKTGVTVVTVIEEEVKEVWTPETGEFREVEVKELSRDSYEEERATCEIVEENEITKLINNSKEFYLRDPVNGFELQKYFSVAFKRFESVDEQTLLDLSKYYVVAFPFLTCRLNNTYYHIIKVYYNGREIEVPLNSFDTSAPSPLNFRITLRRFALTRHYKSLLPYGDHFDDPQKFVEFARSAYEKVRELGDRIKVKEVTPFERFLEIFYLRTPKRKFRSVEPHFKLYEKLLETLKDKPTLYIAFPNKYGERGANYACIRIDGEKYTVMGIAQVPITAITIKGKFEEAYKIVHGLKKLLSYQFAPKGKKIQMLKEDIEALRKEIEEKFGKISELHPENDIMKWLFERAENYEGDNLVLLLYKARRLERAPGNVTLLKLAGLIKSGKDYDYTEDRLKDVLEALRIAVKYEIKSRGYSTKLGVIFSGTAYEIARKVVETVNRVMEKRMQALLAEILTETEEEDTKVDLSVGRLQALMRELEPLPP